VIDRGRFRTTPKAIDKWFTDVPHARVAMEAGVYSIWISEQLEQLGHEVIVANVRELRTISHSDRVERIWRREVLKIPQKQKPCGRLWLNDGSRACGSDRSGGTMYGATTS
jgi:transposase